ncbi:root phototropism protein 2-like [Panicum virgatum]|uniref:root phototropism protein 2-like n=1 Tax=Panicum virgatum TaxID=38727 RepID=UPI0019D6717E|nr:root phototropism protein 2-like [Panicum virgatum]
MAIGLEREYWNSAVLKGGLPCGYVRRAVAKDPSAAVELDLSELPGGADAFKKAARYCYGANFEITARNAAALRCAAAFLDMQHRADLARRVDEFQAQAALCVLPSAVTVLRSCEALLPASEELDVVRLALRICNEALFPTRTPPGWWTTELKALSPASFEKVVTALRCRRADPKVLGNAASAYAELVLAEVLADPRDREDRRALVESVVGVLPSAADAPIQAAFLCRLLHAAVTTEASARTCRDLELRVAAVLEQDTTRDLLGVALYGAGERVRNTNTVRCVIAAFVERHAAASTESGRSRRRASLSGGRAAEVDLGAMEKVARTVDELVAELATGESLAISKFVGVAGAVPKEARG